MGCDFRRMRDEIGTAVGTTEYDDVDPTMLMNQVPDGKFWNAVCADDDPDGPPVKRLVILDDLEMKGADRLYNLGKLFRYVASHKGFSLCLAHQNFFGMDPLIKKVANIFVVWKPRARNELALIENRVGLEKGQLKEHFDTVTKDDHDNITIDHTKNSPATLRLNLFTPIELDG